MNIPPMNYPLCLICIRVADAMTAVLWTGPERCVVCDGNRQCRPAGNESVKRAFAVYLERLQMAFTRATSR